MAHRDRQQRRLAGPTATGDGVVMAGRRAARAVHLPLAGGVRPRAGERARDPQPPRRPLPDGRDAAPGVGGR